MFKNFAIVFVLVCCMSFTTFQDKLLFSEINGTYNFYTQTSISSDFVSVDSKLAKDVKRGLKNLCGESITFKFDKKIIDKVLSTYKAKYLFSEQGDSFCSEYYYSYKIPFYQLIDGVKVNLQVAKTTEYAVIGSPLIYGGF